MNRSTPIRNKCRSARRSGMAVLEMSLVLFVLLSLCFGTIEFGYYFFVKNTLQGAAREGARAGINSGATDADVKAAVLLQLKNAGLLSSTATSLTPYVLSESPSTVSNCSTGSNFSVTVTGTWGTVGSGFRPYAIISATKTVSGSATMRKEG